MRKQTWIINLLLIAAAVALTLRLRGDWTRALARYNGSLGRTTYPALVMSRWQRVWRF